MPKPKKKLTKPEREKREADKRQRRKEAHEDTKRRRLAVAGLQYDPRTAQGRRNFDIASLGPSMMVSLNHFNNCFKRRADRTNGRILAWSKFDRHCHKVHAGEIPPQKFEKGVDISKRPSVNEDRLDAMRADTLLRAWLGRALHDLLKRVIWEQKNFRELEAEGYGPEKLVSLMFKQALDEAAVYWGIGEDNRFGQAVSRVLHASESL